MKQALGIILFLVISSCSKLLMEKQPKNNPIENFNSLWNVVNEKYSYFELKNINWDEIKIKYESQINNNISDYELSVVLSRMLNELRDGHVNLYSGFNVSRNWEWYLNFPENFNYSLIERNYLGKDHSISGGFRYSRLKTINNDNYVIYIYYGSFSNSAAYIDLISNISKDKNCKGLIFDVRNNGGGNVYNAYKIANTFANEKKLVLKEYYKNGKSHDDFSKAYDYYLEPENTIRKPIIVLSNRKSFSATSFFCGIIKTIPNVKIMGDTTGGGAGLPIDYELPNKWNYRFTSTRSKYLDKDGEFKDFELGVAPHIVLPEIPKDTMAKGKDLWINYAFFEIMNI